MGCGSSVHASPPSAGSQGAPGDKPQPVTPDSRLLRGQAYYASGRVAEALKEYNATIAAWPTYARAYLERGNLRMEQEDYSLAVGDYTMALQLQSNLLQAYVMRCHARMALRQFAEALQDARAAEKLDPENAQVRALKAQVRKAMAGGGTSPTAQGGAGGGAGIGVPEEEDAFAGMETPKSTPSPSVRKLCMVCMDVERECRLRPCMHAALCVECADGLMTRGYGCPICSSKIEQVERGTFMRTFTVEEAQGIVATARIIAAMPSPGKSPLGRRFPAGAANAPSLDGIVEGDEEAHSSPDAAAQGAAATAAAGCPLPGRSASTASGVSGGSVAGRSDGGSTAPPPPVELDPHPLATRTQGASSRRRSAEQEAPPAATPAAAATGGPLAAESSEIPEEPAAAAAARSGGTAGGDGDGEVTSPGTTLSPGGVSGVTSTQLANSLADWIDLPTGGEATAAGRPEGGRKAPTAAAARPTGAATAGAAAATAAVAGAAAAATAAAASPPTAASTSSGPSQRRLADTFSGFSTSQQGRLGAAAPQAGPGPVAEACGSRGGATAAAAVPSIEVGVSSEGVACVVGRVFFHGEPRRWQGQGHGQGQGAAPLPQQPAGSVATEQPTSSSGRQDEDSNLNGEAPPLAKQRQDACRSLAVRVRMGIPMGRHRYAASGAGGGSSSGGAGGEEDADGGGGEGGTGDSAVGLARSSNDAGGGARSSRCLHVGAGASASAGAAGAAAHVGNHSSSSGGGVEGARVSGPRALSAGSSGAVAAALSDGRRSSGSGRLGLGGGGIISGTGAPDGWVGRAPGPMCSSRRSPQRLVDPRSLRAVGSSSGGGATTSTATSTAATNTAGGGGSVIGSDRPPAHSRPVVRT